MSIEINSHELWVEIDIADQSLSLKRDDQCIWQVPISTGSKGAGEQAGSEKTPRGWHQIRAKIGADQAENTVFVGRRTTGEIYTPELAQSQPDRDWVLSRILWLSGLEKGKNRLGRVDTQRRYIYLHGTPANIALGQPGSHGCVRMKNADIIYLFDQVVAGTKVLIHE